MNRSLHFPAIAFAIFLAMSSGMAAAVAQDVPTDNWPEVKCARYKQAWSEILSKRGKQGLGQEFLERHEAFLASKCTTQTDVCPRSDDEMKLANMMVIAAMNAGTASTFPPFYCRK